MGEPLKCCTGGNHTNHTSCCEAVNKEPETIAAAGGLATRTSACGVMGSQLIDY